MNLPFWTIALIGHIGFWCIIYNRTHATRWPRRIRKRCEYFSVAMVLAIFCWIGIRAWSLGTLEFLQVANVGLPEKTYLFGAVLLGVFLCLRWCTRKFTPLPKKLLSRSNRVIDVQKELGENIYRTPLGLALKRVPLNQSHLISVEELTFHVPNLPRSLDGLKICHLSDFHFTGQIDQAYFRRIVEAANSFRPNLVLITGDLIDVHDCLDWIEPIFGELNPQHSTWFVRGNHDMRITDQTMLLEKLQSAGLNWIGGKCQSIEIRGSRISLCGNELPWFSGAENLQPTMLEPNSLRILLTHTPDQIDWVRRGGFEFDLILAGHNHGGQIALPIIGPIVAPSRYGVLYASGTFEIDAAVMHVSRGIAGDECIRINCLPEVGYITLRSSANA